MSNPRVFRLYLSVQHHLRERGVVRFRPVWKVSRWVYNRLRCGGVISIDVKGRRWFLDPRDLYFTQTMVLTGQHEGWETPLFAALCEPGMTVVDVGANVGYYTVLASERVGPSGRVVAFEPDPTNYALLVRNVTTNGCRNVVTVQKAVSDRIGSARLFLHPWNWGGHSLQGGEGALQDPICVDTTTLDSYFDDGRSRIDMLKIDVEGSEALVLDGAQRMLGEQRVDRIMMEFWPGGLQRCGSSPELVVDELIRHHFCAYRIKDSQLVQTDLADLMAVCEGNRHGYTHLFLMRQSQSRVHLSL